MISRRVSPAHYTDNYSWSVIPANEVTAPSTKCRHSGSSDCWISAGWNSKIWNEVIWVKLYGTEQVGRKHEDSFLCRTWRAYGDLGCPLFPYDPPQTSATHCPEWISSLNSFMMTKLFSYHHFNSLFVIPLYPLSLLSVSISSGDSICCLLLNLSRS